MCGIAGILDLAGRPVERSRLERMARAIAHRGPDDKGFWLDGPIGLAHRRLSIRDPSAAGRQPMHSADRRVAVTFNGEIYNDRDLRRRLSNQIGASFHTSCDTEVLPVGYQAWGHDIFAELEGIFAFAVWDRPSGTLTLVRDGAGTKPLFYAELGGVLLFASELKGVLAGLDTTPEIDPVNLHRFLAQGYTTPVDTTLQGVRQVPPGSALAFGPDGAARRYTFYRPRRTGEITDLDEAAEAFESLWWQVVNDQLISDVPVGVLQSGGIDSSLVSYGLSRQRKVPLFTAHFAERTHDETDLAAQVAAATGQIHHVVPVQGADGAADTLRQVVWAFDGQVADASAFATYQLSQAVRRHVTVALGGDGADECFGGYDTYKASRAARWLQPWLPASLARAGARGLCALTARQEGRLPAAEIGYRFLSGLANGGRNAHVHWRRLVPDYLLDPLYGPGLGVTRGRDPFDAYTEVLQEGGGSLIDRCLLADQRFHLPAALLMKTDLMSMAHALEVRVPFLDTRVIDFAGRCHVDLLTPKRGSGKRLLRRALSDMGAPESVIRGAKRGFNVPVAQLLRGPLRELGEQYLGNGGELLAPYLQPHTVRRMWEDHLASRANHGYALWPILTFTIWRESL